MGAASSSRCSVARRRRGRSRRARSRRQSSPALDFSGQPAPNEKEFNAFRSGLRALGYVEGRTLSSNNDTRRVLMIGLGEFAAELVRLKMDVIVVDGPPAAKAAKAAIADIPIVFTLAVDPVADGLVASMARPGGNLTGLTLSVGHQLAGKRVELLKDIKPGVARLAVLKNPNQPSASPYLSEAEKVARALGLTVRTFDARSPGDLPAAFAAMVEWRADGVITLNDGMLYSQRERVVTLARESRLASMYPETAFVEAGGLVVVWPEPARSVPARRLLRRQNFERREACRLADRAAHQIRACRQSQNGASLGLTVGRDFCCAPTR